jgi:acyl-CoA dehydrogenase family member 9
MLKFVKKIHKFSEINRSIITARQISLSHTNQQQPKTDELEKHAKTNISAASDKLPKRDPFVKNLFLGLVDKEILTFPEVLKKDDVEELEKSVEKFGSSYQHQVCGNKELTQPELITQLKSLNVFATNVSKDYDGSGLTATEYCLYNEKEGNDVNLATKLNAHRVVTSVIEKYGSVDQKERFLRKLASGELIGSVALFEDSVPENAFFHTAGKENINDDKEWLLNGKKSFVVNCPNATLLVVLCQTLYRNRDSVTSTGVSVFLVDTTVSKGITVAALDEKIGMPNTEQASVSFVNTAVPAGKFASSLLFRNIDIYGQSFFS